MNKKKRWETNNASYWAQRYLSPARGAPLGLPPETNNAQAHFKVNRNL